MYSVFFAIPFDPAIRSMYDKLIQSLHGLTKYEKKLDFEYGGEMVVGPSKKFADIEAFKAQNDNLLSQFKSQITSSDIIVADLTNNNPNVHLELGLALAQNKNILRVTGRDIVQVASDIAGYYVYHYPYDMMKFRKDLEKYFDMFLAIKRLPLNKKGSGRLYEKHPPTTLKVDEEKYLLDMRDGEVRVEFQLNPVTYGDRCWFGASIRALRPWAGGYIVYVRGDGTLELLRLRGGNKPLRHSKGKLVPNKNYVFRFRVDGGRLLAALNDNFDDALDVPDLADQAFGPVFLRSFGTQAKLSSIESVCRDTINFA